MLGLAQLAGRVALAILRALRVMWQHRCARRRRGRCFRLPRVCVAGLILLHHDYFLIILICRLIAERLFCFCCFECVGVVRILEKINMCIAGVLYFLLGRDLISDTRLW